MILRRLGNKKKIAKKIQVYFPAHKIYIEPFFGAGGMFFNKPKAIHNIINDLDSDVFNFYNIVSKNKDDLIEMIKTTPINEDLFKHWVHIKETEPIKKAFRYMYITNLSFCGLNNTFSTNPLTFDHDNFNSIINFSYEYLKNTKITNKDFRKLLTKINFPHGEKDKINTFIYADAPYLKTNDTYSNSFTEKDSIDLFDSLEKTGCKFAMSEFDNEFVLKEAKKRNLNIIYIGERQNLKNRRTEILITNYKNNPSLFDGLGCL